MAGAKANFVSFYIRRIGRILPIYYAIHFLVLLANSQAWSTDFKVSMYTFKQFQEPEWTGHVWTWCVILADKATLGSCNFKKCSTLRSVYSGLYDRDRGHCETPIRKALDSWKIRFCMILCFCLKDSVLLLCTWHGSSPSTNFPAWTVCALFWPLCQRSSESSDSWNILEYKYMVTPPSEPTFSIFWWYITNYLSINVQSWHMKWALCYLLAEASWNICIDSRRAKQWKDETLRCWLFAPLPSKLLFWARQSRSAKVPIGWVGRWDMMGRYAFLFSSQGLVRWCYSQDGRSPWGIGAPTYPLGVWLLMVVLGTLDEVWSRSVPCLPLWIWQTPFRWHKIDRAPALRPRWMNTWTSIFGSMWLARLGPKLKLCCRTNMS